jgi:hypothetical protein
MMLYFHRLLSLKREALWIKDLPDLSSVIQGFFLI